MSLRTKVVAAFVACTTVACVLVGALSYRSIGDRLDAEVDASLEAAMEPGIVRPLPGGPSRSDRDGVNPRAAAREPSVARGDVRMQWLATDGAVVAVVGADLPVDPVDLELASSGTAGVELWRTVESDEGDGTAEPSRLRMLTRSVAGGASDVGAIQAGRSLAENDRVLASLRTRILVLTGVVVALAAVVGWLLARRITDPLVKVAAAADRVAGTGDLRSTVPAGGSDEVGRLGAAFNEMLAALARSREAQSRLVQDAGHELRTPMTSLRTNLYSLRDLEALQPAERARVLADLEGEAAELSRLVDEVVEVATDARSDEEPTVVDLRQLAESVAAQAARRTGREVTVAGTPSPVVARPRALTRAVRNLVDNACKFDTSGGPIRVEVEGSGLRVVDGGPGVDPGDLPHVFDRFYRSVGARAMPGSGLGLAIVADVVAAEGGTAFVANGEGGGAVFGFELPRADDSHRTLT